MWQTDKKNEENLPPKKNQIAAVVSARFHSNHGAVLCGVKANVPTAIGLYDGIYVILEQFSKVQINLIVKSV